MWTYFTLNWAAATAILFVYLPKSSAALRKACGWYHSNAAGVESQHELFVTRLAKKNFVRNVIERHVCFAFSQEATGPGTIPICNGPPNLFGLRPPPISASRLPGRDRSMERKDLSFHRRFVSLCFTVSLGFSACPNIGPCRFTKHVSWWQARPRCYEAKESSKDTLLRGIKEKGPC